MESAAAAAAAAVPAAGCWLLAAGCWLLAAGFRTHARASERKHAHTLTRPHLQEPPIDCCLCCSPISVPNETAEGMKKNQMCAHGCVFGPVHTNVHTVKVMPCCSLRLRRLWAYAWICTQVKDLHGRQIPDKALDVATMSRGQIVDRCAPGRNFLTVATIWAAIKQWFPCIIVGQARQPLSEYIPGAEVGYGVRAYGVRGSSCPEE